MTRFDQYGEAELARLMAPVAAAECRRIRRMWGGKPSPDEARQADARQLARLVDMRDKDRVAEYLVAKRQATLAYEDAQRRATAAKREEQQQKRDKLERDLMDLLTHAPQPTHVFVEALDVSFTTAANALRRLVDAGKVERTKFKPAMWKRS